LQKLAAPPQNTLKIYRVIHSCNFRVEIRTEYTNKLHRSRSKTIGSHNILVYLGVWG